MPANDDSALGEIAGSPAFPGKKSKVLIPAHLAADAQIITEDYTGLTVRQYYAAMAMQGMQANPDLIGAITSLHMGPGTYQGALAKKAFEIADAMIEAEKK